MAEILWTLLDTLLPPDGMEVIVRGPLVSERRAYRDGLTWLEAKDGPNGLLVGVITEWRNLREAGIDDKDA